MPAECFWGICFVALDASEPKFFGFAEYLASLALMVIAWTIADVRYKFRVSVAPLPMVGVTFWIVLGIGVLTLATDLWRSEEWLVPKGDLVSPAGWQAILGGIFLSAFLSWAYFAFIKPPVFSKLNAKRYLEVLYGYILRGSHTELPIIANEVARSVKSIIRLCPEEHELWEYKSDGKGPVKRTRKKLKREMESAEQVLLLLADRKLCESVIEHSVTTAYHIFQEMKDQGKFAIPVQPLARNLTSCAVRNKNSFIYHETHGYDSGLIGYIKPVSQAMYSNFLVVESAELLNVRYDDAKEFDEEQLKGYFRISLLAFQDYCRHSDRQLTRTFLQVFEIIERCSFDLYKIDGIESGAYETDTYRRFDTCCNFIPTLFDAFRDLSKIEVGKVKKTDKNSFPDIYDRIADAIFTLITKAGSVSSPKDFVWIVQHNTLWSDIFGYSLRKKVDKVDEVSLIFFRLRRLIYDEITGMEEFPNYQGARCLAVCLNVMKFEQESYHYREEKPLHKAVISWVRKHFAELYEKDQDVAQACLVNGLSYDEEKNRLIRENSPLGSKKIRGYSYLELSS